MKLSTIVTAALLALLPATAAGATGWAADALDAGLAAYAAGDYATARAQFVRLADHGSAIGETMLGTIYSRGQGVTADAATAAAYWFRAASRGYAPAQLAMARALTSGTGVNANPASAWVWAQLAATHGDPGTAAEAATVQAGLDPLFTPAQRTAMAQKAEQWRPWADGGR